MRQVVREAGRRVPGAVSRAFDRLHGTESVGLVELETLGLADPERVRHHPSDWMSTRRALTRLDPGPDDVLVDFGCGKGRTLAIASGLPFGRVIGVELSPELAAIAERNVAAVARRRRAGAVGVTVSDVLDFEIPDDLTVAYFFSPFTGSIFERVLDRLLESLDRRPRRMRVVYNYPTEHKSLMRTGRFTVVDATPSNWLEPISDLFETIVTYDTERPAGTRRLRPAARRRLEYWADPG